MNVTVTETVTVVSQTGHTSDASESESSIFYGGLAASERESAVD